MVQKIQVVGGNRIINPLAVDHAAQLEQADPNAAVAVWKDPGSLIEYSVKVVDDMVTENPWPRHVFQVLIVIGLVMWILSRYVKIRDIMSPPSTRRNKYH
jgi:hypothetical protein